jgi:O-antigen ligase
LCKAKQIKLKNELEQDEWNADFLKYISAKTRPIRVIRILCLAPFLLALSTVFIVNDDLANGVVSGKYFWFYGSMGLVAVVTVVATIIARPSTPLPCGEGSGERSSRFSTMDLLVLLFAAAIYLPACLRNDTALNTSKLTNLALLVVLYFNFRLIINISNRKNAAQHILCLFIILTGLIEAVWGLRQLYGFEHSQHSLFKLTGSFFNPGPYAGYLAVVFPIALHYGLQGKHHNPLRIFGAITCVVLLLVLPAAMSRAAWLAVVTGSIAVFIGKWNVDNADRADLHGFSPSGKKYLKIRANPLIPCHPRSILPYLSVFIAVVLIIAALVGMYYLKKDSADGRALTWKISFQTIAKHPFGVGLGNFPSAYGETQIVYFASGQATETEQLVAGNPEYGFNEYLQIAVESGIIAVLLFVGIIVLAVRNTVKAKNWGVLGSLTALLVFAFFSYPFSVLPFLIVFVFLLAIGQRQADTLNLRHRPVILLALCCLLVTAACLWKQYSVYQAYRQWKTNQIYYHVGLYKDTAESYETLYPYLNDQIRFLFEYAQCLSKAGLNDRQRIKTPARCDSLLNKSNEVLHRAMQISCDPMLYNIMGKNCQAIKRYSEAEACYIQASLIVPNRLYPWYLLTKLYDEMGLKDKVHETAAIVLAKEPKVQSPAIKEMREEVEKLRIKN